MLIDSDPWRVMDREKNWSPGGAGPAWDVDFIQELFVGWDGRGELTLADTLEWLDTDPARADALRADMKLRTRWLADVARDACPRGSEMRDAYESKTYTPSGCGPQTQFILDALESGG